VPHQSKKTKAGNYFVDSEEEDE